MVDFINLYNAINYYTLMKWSSIFIITLIEYRDKNESKRSTDKKNTSY